ncbi:MAG: hypothetical protein KF762_03620 [Acidobacteria bacterium]|nr:hypothetical protein [Acidobacteriota bacterium]
MSSSIQNTMLYRIRGKGRGWAFSARHFLDLGGRDAIDKSLSRLARKGAIRRVGSGIYDYPKISPELGVLSPSIDGVAKEIASKNNSRLKITGAQAANALGLSTQVPARIVYLTDGPSRQLKIGNQTIILKHASPKTMATADKGSGTVIQALRYIGKDNVTPDHIGKIKNSLSDFDKRELRNDINTAPEWMKPMIMKIVE